LRRATLPKSWPGTVFSWILVPYPIFEIYEKPPFGPSFHANMY
jgi:hypothetical protein